MAAVDKILRNSGALLRVTFYVDGVATDADSLPTFAVADEWGDSIQTGTAVATGPTGQYELVFPPKTELHEYAITWTGFFSAIQQSVVTFAETVGNNLFSVQEARDFRPEGKTVRTGLIADTTKYPTSVIIETREEITELFEVLLGFSPVERSHFVTIDGNWGRGSDGGINIVTSTSAIRNAGTSSDALYLKSELNAINRIDCEGVTLVLADQDLSVYKYGRVHRGNATWPLGEQNIEVQYEHGTMHTPAPIIRAALIMLHAYMVGSDVMDRSVTHTDETGTYRLSVPDMARRRTTGIPHVDAIIANYAEDWIIA